MGEHTEILSGSEFLRLACKAWRSAADIDAMSAHDFALRRRVSELEAERDRSHDALASMCEMLDAAEARVRELSEALRAIAVDDPAISSGVDEFCFWCGGLVRPVVNMDNEWCILHEDACTWVRARAALGQIEGTQALGEGK